MKREIIDFYAARNIPVEKLIPIGRQRKGLTDASIIAAAEDVYRDIQGGMEIKPTRIAWEVFSRAKLLMGKVEKKALDKKIELENDYATLQAKYDDLELQGVIDEARRKRNEANLMERICEMQRVIDWYEQPWWKTLFRRPANG